MRQYELSHIEASMTSVRLSQSPTADDHVRLVRELDDPDPATTEPPSAQDRASRTLSSEMSTAHPEPAGHESLELPVEDLLRRARPHPPYGEQVIDDLTAEEAEAFLAAVLS